MSFQYLLSGDCYGTVCQEWGGVYKYNIKWTITSSCFSDIKYMANQIYQFLKIMIIPVLLVHCYISNGNSLEFWCLDTINRTWFSQTTTILNDTATYGRE